jgi:hypothetical protein
MAQVTRALERCDAIRDTVEAHCTPDRLTRYLRALADTPAPSGAASLMRAPVLRHLLTEDGALEGGGLQFDPDHDGTGAATLSCGGGAASGLWFIAHLDSISYLLQPARDGRYPLVPYCYHLTESGERDARALRYDLDAGTMVTCATGRLVSDADGPSFVPDGDIILRPGDRIVPVTPFTAGAGGLLTGHFDNAGGVAAMAVAAPVLAGLGASAFFAMPDEEEGPAATGNQSISRGASRLLAAAPTPRLSVVIDMQQTAAEGNGGPNGAGVPGAGAVLSEFSSRARGAVTPPHLYAAVRAFAEGLEARGATVRETSNLYTSRSDDVAVMQRSPGIVILGFPGADRHFDTALPTAHLSDFVSLSRALVYMALLFEELEGPRR